METFDFNTFFYRWKSGQEMQCAWSLYTANGFTEERASRRHDDVTTKSADQTVKVAVMLVDRFEQTLCIEFMNESQKVIPITDVVIPGRAYLLNYISPEIRTVRVLISDITP